MTAACAACAVAPAAQDRVAGHLPARPDRLYSLPGIHCAACIRKVEDVAGKLADVSEARVNLSLKRLSVVGDVPDDLVVEALARVGYEAHPLDRAALENDEDTLARGLLIRLSVAGFAMMNIMLLSVAVWSGATDATRDLFHLISAAIAVPVVGYAGQPFFTNAMRALRAARLNMDVPISLAILLATGMSLYETLNHGAHAYFDAAVSLTFFLLIGRYLDHRSRSAARSAAAELTALEVQTAAKLHSGGTRQHVPVDTLKIGDRVLVPTGQRVMVDGTLDSDGATMDRAFLTGESAPIRIGAGDKVQAGEINLGAPLQITATAVGADTTLRRLAALVERAENGRNSYTALADRAAAIYAPLVHVLALAAFLGWVWIDGDVRHALNVAIAVLIITCPCALGLAVPAVSTAAISRLYGAGFLVKHPTALERLAEIDAVVIDKTGTATLPQSNGLNVDIGDTERGIALALAQASAHPVARAIAGGLHGVRPADVTEIEEIAGKGVQGRLHGMPVRLGNANWLGGRFAGSGLKIGAQSVVPVSGAEELRPGMADAVAGFHDTGLGVSLLTGDREDAARPVADALGITEMKAGISAEEKQATLKAAAAHGARVLMIGDGLNDTAALSTAHASIAPSSALDAARSAADIVVVKEDFAQLPMIHAVARAMRRISKQNFAIAAGYNMIAVPLALIGVATPLMAALAMSFSSITVILNAQRVRRVR